MPHGMTQLKNVLEEAAAIQREELATIIDAPFAPFEASPDKLCDHLNFLRHGSIGQLTTRSSYKQLVTDVADRLEIDWGKVCNTRHWDDVPTREIEEAVIAALGGNFDPQIRDHRHLPIPNEVLEAGIHELGRLIPGLTFVARPLSEFFGGLKTEWKKIVMALIYIHTVIRPSVNQTS